MAPDSLISVEKALERIRAVIRPMPSETINIAQAAGRVLAKEYRARVTQPRRNVSAMDGYACRTEDIARTPVKLDVVGSAPAGHPFRGSIGSREAVRIFTGGQVPSGADTIVVQENTESHGNSVVIRKSAATGRHIRLAGLDFVEGANGTVVGRRLAPRDIALAAAMNVPWLSVRQPPKVGIISMGDELVQPGEPLGSNNIVSSNALGLAALISDRGGQPIDLGIAHDNQAAIHEMAKKARNADLLVTIGGASVGEFDLVRPALEDLGLRIDFWRIAMRPGKPLMFGQLGNLPVLGLPGNPVSSLICGLVFVSSAIHALLARTDHAVETVSAFLGSDLPENDARQDYLRASLHLTENDHLVATPFATQDSSMLSLLAKADCLVLRPPNAPAAKSGDLSKVIPLNRTDGAV